MTYARWEWLKAAEESGLTWRQPRIVEGMCTVYEGGWLVSGEGVDRVLLGGIDSGRPNIYRMGRGVFHGPTDGFECPADLRATLAAIAEGFPLARGQIVRGAP